MSLDEKVVFLPPLSGEDKMLSGLAYPGWFIGPIFVLLSPKKEDPFLCFHSIQGILVGLVSVVLELALFFAIWIFFQVAPNGGTAASGLFGVTLFGGGLSATMVLFLVALFLGWRASAGQYLKLPILGPLAERLMGRMLGLDEKAMRAAAISRPLEPVRPESSPTLPPIFPEDFNADAAKAYVAKLFPGQPLEGRARPADMHREAAPPRLRPDQEAPRPSAPKPSAGLPPRTVPPVPKPPQAKEIAATPRPKPFLPQTSRPN